MKLFDYIRGYSVEKGYRQVHYADGSVGPVFLVKSYKTLDGKLIQESHGDMGWRDHRKVRLNPHLVLKSPFSSKIISPEFLPD